MILTRRTALLGLGSLLAAPAVVRASSLMPVRTIVRSGNGIVYSVYSDPRLRAIDFVRDCGGIGDGITDNTRAYQRAVEWAENNQGGTVYFPEGTYAGLCPLLPTINYVGAGADTTTITPSGELLQMVKRALAS